MLYVRGANDIEPSARLEDPKIIKDIANKCGMRTKIVSAPSLEEAEDIIVINNNNFKISVHFLMVYDITGS